MEKEKLFLYKIDLNELGVIYSPLVEDILQMGQSEFYRLIYPFIVDFDDFEIKEENREGLVKFDLFTISKELINSLITSLKYFYKTDDITYANNIVMISIPSEDKFKMKSTFITRDNFDELCGTICKIVNYEKVKEEKREVEVEVLSEEGKKALELLNKHRKQKQEDKKEGVSLKQIINTVVHGGKYTYKQVFEMTYYQLINSYQCVMQLDGYKTYMSFKTSGQFEMKESMEHWSELMK